MKKGILLLGFPLLFAGLASAQQTFTLTHTTVEETTDGTEDPGSAPVAEWDYVQLDSEVQNNSSTTYPYKWQLMSKDLPAGWGLVGFCDNITCFAGGVGSTWEGFQVKESNPIAPGEEGILHLRIGAPVGAANGTATVKFKVFTDDQTDSVTYILHKGSTGISIIDTKDARVAIFPNPANDQVTVFADAALKPATISVFNILGRQVMAQAVNKNGNDTKLDIGSLAAGAYMIRVADEKGNTITSRKLTKQ